MKDIILKNRYNEKYKLVYKQGNEYKFEGDTDYLRVGSREGDDSFKSIHFIDPSGGPMLVVGGTIEGKRINSINSKEDGYYLELI